MYLVQTDHYIDLATELCEAIGEEHFYSGHIYLETEDADCKLIISTLVSFSHVDLPEGEYDQICDITPIWWEFHTTTLDGEQINDFDLETFKRYIRICQ
ncbi:MAG: hypothetical protein SNH01_02130 [Rikenellaceae bacterium]